MIQNLWAPWRSSYVTGGSDNPPGCIFCTKPARGPEHFAEELILVATADCFVMLNKFPYNNGHFMVIPRAHVASPTELEAAVHASLWRTVSDSIAALERAFRPHGINVGMNLGRTAGAGIAEHCHVHVVPRWDGDTNFMPVIGETKVISQHLEETYAALLPHFISIPGVVAVGKAAGTG